MFQIHRMCFSNRLTLHKVIVKVRHSCVIKRIGRAIATFLKFLFHTVVQQGFLPRCMECSLGLAMRKVSVRPFVCLSQVHCDKTEKDLSRLLYHMKKTFSLIFLRSLRLTSALCACMIRPKVSTCSCYDLRQRGLSQLS